MKRRPLTALYVATLCGVSLAALMPQGAQAAEEIQILRRTPADPQTQQELAFTTFQQEVNAITQSLPCKWISKEGRLGPSYGNARYDFLCKGGDFATVSLYLDKSSGSAQGVASVRLIYRDWVSSANPNAGEAMIAEQFLRHVTGRFIPADQAPAVSDIFWTTKPRKWREGGLEIAYEYDQPRGAAFALRKLTVKAVKESLGVQMPVFPFQSKTKQAGTPAPKLEQGVDILIYDKDGRLVPNAARPIPGVAVAPNPIITPTDAGLSRPVVENPAPAVLPAPAGSLPVSVGIGGAAGALVVPATAPAGPKLEKKGTLQPATPAELNTAPAPESQKAPEAPTSPAANLVPTVDDLVTGGQRAPSNFDAYNRAMELTKDVENKAQITRVEEARVTASKTTTPTMVLSPTQPAPSLKPVPTPGVQDSSAAPQIPAGEGLSPRPASQVPATPEPSSLPANYQGPRSSSERPLPQLKFIPKAVPNTNPTDVIKFEDESSAL
ncbi:MAG: hypothetical protein DI628_02100 [Blastochloris viridis]|uniref:Uncharacterized protein n=1 Tax=Blastochloris viridis TaxID=1079 RepID=A0A6N4RBN3_BLAVI|nr:MAG: hypothetical protein DI628_02100 [Blastochloris viridis]